ncbi:MAG: hypothetical protein K8I00_13420, partial [Candidatus Omnitrophica bacterium]|nr:hypothetical protein [Candidatus Omnitrophota bacterium]
VKKGEDEIITLSQKSKIQLEATTTNLKKEKLYYQIGKEYVQLSDTAKPSAKLTQLLEVYHDLEQEQKTLSTKLKRQTTKKTPKKTAKKTVQKAAPKTKVRKTVKKAVKKS